MAKPRIHAAIIDHTGAVQVLGSASALFPWWSFTKTALAICALKLCEERLLGLDELRTDKPFTLRQLLQHRASAGKALI